MHKRGHVPTLVEPCGQAAGKAPLFLSFSLSSPPLQEKYLLESMSGRVLVLPLDYQDIGQGRWIAKIQPEGR